MAIAHSDFTENSSTAQGGAIVIETNVTEATVITHCDFIGNEAFAGPGGGAIIAQSAVAVTNCLFARNRTVGVGNGGLRNGGAVEILPGAGTSSFDNVTFAYNFAGYQGGAIDMRSSANVTNCIFWGGLSGRSPNAAVPADEFWIRGGATLDIDFSIINFAQVINAGTLINGPNNLGIYPEFGNEAIDDYHLKSPFGRWDPISGNFVFTDTVFSPAIDTGDPTTAYANETLPNGSNVNMGAYGNTVEASKSGFGSPLLVFNLPADDITGTSATLNGQMVQVDVFPTTVRIYYGTSNGGTNPAAWDTNVLVGIGVPEGLFDLSVSGLTPGETYHYSAFASNSSSQIWGEPVQAFSSSEVRLFAVQDGRENGPVDGALMAVRVGKRPLVPTYRELHRLGNGPERIGLHSTPGQRNHSRRFRPGYDSGRDHRRFEQ